MKRLDLPEALQGLSNKIQGDGVEVFFLDSVSPLVPGTDHELHLHALLIILDGAITVECNSAHEVLKKDEAIMLKKESIVSIKTPVEGAASFFRSLIIFFDEPSLRYALMPFELPASTPNDSMLKIPLNDKLKVFTESILLYYKSNKDRNNWAVLLKNKLRELVWIFFHTDIREQAKQFFSDSR